ncbi:histone H1oo [Trichechus manatus latirostris]|uniref:Histone H1.8 n=1 Tax=Trichechus manatus latirostris TaxID=127582 RepID=A0A2Y9D6J8_TRIMA|nr:histone H1oo [Trichechus manatus latirostris]
MAAGSYAYSDTSEASSAGSAGPSGSERPGPSHGGVQVQRRNPTVLRMVLEALQAGEQRQGTSVVAIKQYILQKYPTVSVTRLKYLLKQALAKGISRGLLIRPLNSKARGATGSFKLVSKKKRIIQPRKKSTIMPTQKPGEAKEKGPKNPSKAKKDPPHPGKVKKVPKKPGKVKKVPPKPDTAKEKTPKKGGKAKAKVAKVGEAKKVPPKPEKAPKAPPDAAGLSGKSTVKGSTSSQADAEAPRKANAGSKSSKAKASKGKNGATFPAAKKTAATAQAPKGAAAQGPGKEPKAKAAAPPKGKGSGGSKTAPVHLAKKTEAPKGPRRPGLPAKASLSKTSIKKAKAES